MFTGIIEEIGIVREFKKGTSDALITVECKDVLGDTKLGDSISINGVCQTVVQISGKSFSAQISSETLNVTNFATIKTGDRVNLERAMTLSQRMGGHIVSGHVDGLAKVKNIQKLSDFYNLKFEVGQELTKYIVKKGSVALNGISLTVANIVNREFEVAIIPHTFENTVLSDLKQGCFVNIEVDVLAKYVEKILSTGDNKGNLDEKFLMENGFF